MVDDIKQLPMYRSTSTPPWEAGLILQKPAITYITNTVIFSQLRFWGNSSPHEYSNRCENNYVTLTRYSIDPNPDVTFSTLELNITGLAHCHGEPLRIDSTKQTENLDTVFDRF